MIKNQLINELARISCWFKKKVVENLKGYVLGAEKKQQKRLKKNMKYIEKERCRDLLVTMIILSYLTIKQRIRAENDFKQRNN